MKVHELRISLHQHPKSYVRFLLPSGDHIPAHAHITEVGHLVRNFIDCGGVSGKEEKALLQTHVGDDIEHRLKADRFAKILELGTRVLPTDDLDVHVEYDCCVVAQYPIAEAKSEGGYLNLRLERGVTQCRARERHETKSVGKCCATATPSCE